MKLEENSKGVNFVAKNLDCSQKNTNVKGMIAINIILYVEEQFVKIVLVTMVLYYQKEDFQSNHTESVIIVKMKVIQ